MEQAHKLRDAIEKFEDLQFDLGDSTLEGPDISRVTLTKKGSAIPEQGTVEKRRLPNGRIAIKKPDGTIVYEDTGEKIQ